MKLYHLSQSLLLGDSLIPDYQKLSPLCEPFLQALEHSEECFFGMVLSGKYIFRVLDKSGLREWADYAKWATEAIFEFVRVKDFPKCHSRLRSHFFYDNAADCVRLFHLDWDAESEEEKSRVHLFEMDVRDETPQKYDMVLYDEAYEAISDRQDIAFAMDHARRYFSGDASKSPVWELLSDQAAAAVRDLSNLLK